MSFLSNAGLTMAAIAAAAAITVGVLVLVGVGDESREERINRMAEDVVAAALRESPAFCDSWVGGIGLDVGAGDSGLSDADQQMLADRVAAEVQEQCRERSR